MKSTPKSSEVAGVSKGGGQLGVSCRGGRCQQVIRRKGSKNVAKKLLLVKVCRGSIGNVILFTEQQVSPLCGTWLGHNHIFKLLPISLAHQKL